MIGLIKTMLDLGIFKKNMTSEKKVIENMHLNKDMKQNQQITWMIQ